MYASQDLVLARCKSPKSAWHVVTISRTAGVRACRGPGQNCQLQHSLSIVAPQRASPPKTLVWCAYRGHVCSIGSCAGRTSIEHHAKFYRHSCARSKAEIRAKCTLGHQTGLQMLCSSGQHCAMTTRVGERGEKVWGGSRGVWDWPWCMERYLHRYAFTLVPQPVANGGV